MSDYSQYYSAIDQNGNDIDNMHIPLWILKHIDTNNNCSTNNIENMLQSNIAIKQSVLHLKASYLLYLNSLWVNQSNKKWYGTYYKG